MKFTLAIVATLLSMVIAAPMDNAAAHHGDDDFPSLDPATLGGITTGGIVGKPGAQEVASIFDLLAKGP